MVPLRLRIPMVHPGERDQQVPKECIHIWGTIKVLVAHRQKAGPILGRYIPWVPLDAFLFVTIRNDTGYFSSFQTGSIVQVPL